MPDEETLNRRLRAVERSLSNGDHQAEPMRDAGHLAERITALESQLGDAEDRIAELEAVTQALRGYVGNVRSVNEDVEQRAEAALAAVERLEAQVNGGSRGRSIPGRSPVRQPQIDHQEPATTQSSGQPPASESPQAVDDGAHDDEVSDHEGTDAESANTEADSLVDRVRNAF